MPPIFLLAAGLASAQDLVIQHARLWDGTGAPATEDRTILVRDGRIAAIDPPAESIVGAPVVDATGATAIPGLIELHAHLVSDPGANWRTDDEASRQSQVKQGLRALLACGVTTVLDAGTLPAWGMQVHEWLEAGEPGPQVYDLGLALSPKGGYLDGAFPGYPSVYDQASLTSALDASDAMGSIGYKVTFEPGFARPVWPMFDEGMRTAIMEEAARRGKGLFIHGGGKTAISAALSMRPRVLVHPPDDDSPGVLDQVIQSGAMVTSTLMTRQQFRMRAPFDDALTERLTRRVVPAVQLETALQDGIDRRYRRATARVMLPGYRGPALALATSIIGGRDQVRTLRSRGRAFRYLRERGVTLAMGSDSGNWPVFIYLFHGPNSLREIETLSRYAFGPEGALLSATREAAKLLGQLDRIGTLEVGKEADILLVHGDPTHDIHTLWNPMGTVVNGVWRTPEEWMTVAASPSLSP